MSRCNVSFGLVVGEGVFDLRLPSASRIPDFTLWCWSRVMHSFLSFDFHLWLQIGFAYIYFPCLSVLRFCNSAHPAHFEPLPTSIPVLHLLFCLGSCRGCISGSHSNRKSRRLPGLFIRYHLAA